MFHWKNRTKQNKNCSEPVLMGKKTPPKSKYLTFLLNKEFGRILPLQTFRLMEVKGI